MSTVLKVHPPISRITAHATMPGRLVRLGTKILDFGYEYIFVLKELLQMIITHLLFAMHLDALLLF